MLLGAQHIRGLVRGVNSSPAASRGRGDVSRGSPLKVTGTPAYPSTTQMQTAVVHQANNTVSAGKATQGQLTQQNLNGINPSNPDTTLSHTLEKQKEVHIVFLVFCRNTVLFIVNLEITTHLSSYSSLVGSTANDAAEEC